MSSVADPEAAAALEAARTAVGRLLGLPLSPHDVTDAYALIRETEVLGRHLAAVQQWVLREVDRAGLHQADGHASATVMVRTAANLSNAEGRRRGKAMRMLRDLPAVAAAFRTGRIGLPQLDRIARLHGNARVRAALIEVDAHIAELAARLPYPEFDAKLDDWERMADEDGVRDRSERQHANRDYVLHPNFDGSFRHLGGCGEEQGVELRSILAAFAGAELAADWAEARAVHGDATTVEHLARTDAQRRADAHYAIYRAGASALAAAPGGSRVVTNLVMDQETFERELRRACGEDVEPDARLATFFQDLLDDLIDDEDDDDPAHDAEDEAEGRPVDEVSEEHGPVDVVPAPDAEADRGTGSGASPEGPRRRGHAYRCETLDGFPLTPSLVASRALLGHVRRGVIRPDGVTLDLGRLSRLFTGPTQLAVQLSRTTCYWPGCGVPVTQCQTDHLEPFNGPRQGRTCPDNGGPLCGKHNRHKQHGFTVWRDEHSRFHVVRPDGTEIPYLP
ncbi:DUF222 domain-containing protein [Aquihabitans sp. McL0605]|uniref:DUF222 domain-containing protein n=1 Tax=Aquihabitans sp. McL0605 TaxID=3415671 RepID=UPI003CF4A51B